MIFKKKEEGREKTIHTQKDLISLKLFDEEIEAFILNDASYMDLVEIKSKDLSNKNEEDIKYEMLKKMKFYKLYSDDVKIISLNFPISTLLQRKNLEIYKKKTTDDVRKKWLDIMISDLLRAEKNIRKREYYLMYYGDNKHIFLKNKQIILGYVNGYNSIFKNIDIDKKLKIIKKLYNPNSLINIKDFELEEDIWEEEDLQ